MKRNSKRSGKSPRVSRTRKAAGARRPAVKSETVRKPVQAKETGAPAGEGGIALSLLKGFYWIELGIRSYLRSRDNPEFSRAEGMVIANLMLGYSRPSDIARQLGVSRQAIHVTIQQMRVKGIVELIEDPGDKRIKQVVVTDLARKMNDDGIVAMGILWQELANRLGRANLSKAAKVFSSDWGPPIAFDMQQEPSTGAPK